MTHGTSHPPASGSRTGDRLLVLLKTKGPSTAGELAGRLDVTAVAVRQHLLRLQEEGLVAFTTERQGVGRPVRRWHLADAARTRFPESYDELAVDLIGQVRSAFGASGLQRLLDARTDDQTRAYRERMPPPSASLARRVEALCVQRTREGYMASWTREGRAYRLVESHCPLCAAATVCQGLCGSELELFRRVLGDDVEVERTEHLLDGGRRCAYRIARRPRGGGRERGRRPAGGPRGRRREGGSTGGRRSR